MTRCTTKLPMQTSTCQWEDFPLRCVQTSARESHDDLPAGWQLHRLQRWLRLWVCRCLQLLPVWWWLPAVTAACVLLERMAPAAPAAALLRCCGWPPADQGAGKAPDRQTYRQAGRPALYILWLSAYTNWLCVPLYVLVSPCCWRQHGLDATGLCY